ncbi:hypothetical protein C0J52_17590 [Blattella germanica]|nr:hypothetical protein C0J52_17590 [Blattella germanica]
MLRGDKKDTVNVSTAAWLPSEKMSPAVNEYIRTDESTFYNNMKSVLFTLRLMGLLPYHITQQGNLSIELEGKPST